jgi:hypothetical protein
LLSAQETRARIEKDEIEVLQDVIADLKEEAVVLREAVPTQEKVPENWEDRVEVQNLDFPIGRTEATDLEWTEEAAKIPLPEDESFPEIPPTPLWDAAVYQDRIENLQIIHDVEPMAASVYSAVGACAASVCAFFKSVKMQALGGVVSVRNPLSLCFRYKMAWLSIIAKRLGWLIPGGMIIALCLWYVRKYISPHKVKYTFKSHHVQTLVDNRPDAVDSGKLKHEDPKLIWVDVDGPRADIPCLSLKETMLCSAEMFTQLAIPSNFDHVTDDKLAWEKIRYAAKTMHSVNVDRRHVLNGHNVVQNTSLLALAASRQFRDKNAQRHFQRPLPEYAGVWLHMVTVSEKLSSLLLGASRIMPGVAGFALLTCTLVCLYRSTWERTSLASLYPIPTQLIPTRLLQGSQSGLQWLLPLRTLNSS